MPKNIKLMKLYLDLATKNTKTLDEKDDVKYFSSYLKKLVAIEEGDTEAFEEANNEILI